MRKPQPAKKPEPTVAPEAIVETPKVTQSAEAQPEFEPRTVYVIPMGEEFVVRFGDVPPDYHKGPDKEAAIKAAKALASQRGSKLVIL